MLFAWTCEPDDGPRRAKASYQYYYVDLLAARLKGRLSIRAQKPGSILTLEKLVMI